MRNRLRGQWGEMLQHIPVMLHGKPQSICFAYIHKRPENRTQQNLIGQSQRQIPVAFQRRGAAPQIQLSLPLLHQIQIQVCTGGHNRERFFFQKSRIHGVSDMAVKIQCDLKTYAEVSDGIRLYGIAAIQIGDVRIKCTVHAKQPFCVLFCMWEHSKTIIQIVRQKL